MAWFKKQKSAAEVLSKDDPPVGALLNRLAQLTEAEARDVDKLVEQCGLGVSDESADNIAIMLSTSRETNRDNVRAAAQIAGREAAEQSPGGAKFPRVVDAAGVMAQSFAIRGLLDAVTWEYLTRPWREFIDLPAYGEERVGAASQLALQVRAFVEEASRELSRAQARESALEPEWLRTILDRDNTPHFTPPMMEAGMSRSDAERLLAMVRTQVQKRVAEGTVIPEITTRQLRDLAADAIEQPFETWEVVVGNALDVRVSLGSQLDQSMNGPYEVARTALVGYLYPKPATAPPGFDLRFIQEEVMPGLHAVLVIHGSGGRSRPVTQPMLNEWAVRAEVAWADAAHNLASADIKAEPWPVQASPIRRLTTEWCEAEWLGLVAHRLPDSCPTGHLVAMPFRGSALVLRLDLVPSIEVIQAFGMSAADAFRQASEFDDELYPNLIWLRPDGTPVVLFNFLESTGDIDALPPDFLLALVGSRSASGEAGWHA